MNTQTKKRLTIVTLVIVAVLAVILAIVGGGTAAKTISLAEAATGDFADQRVQVSGKVLPNSYTTTEGSIEFTIYQAPSEDEENSGSPTVETDKSVTLDVVYEGGVAATFGNDVEAICTGKIGQDGILRASELVTKCPSKYESGTDTLEVSRLLGYGDAIIDKTVKVHGTVVAGTQQPAGSDERFRLADTQDPSVEMSVQFGGALSEEALADGIKLVLTGDLDANGVFSATDVAIEN